MVSVVHTTVETEQRLSFFYRYTFTKFIYFYLGQVLVHFYNAQVSVSYKNITRKKSWDLNWSTLRKISWWDKFETFTS